MAKGKCGDPNVAFRVKVEGLCPRCQVMVEDRIIAAVRAEMDQCAAEAGWSSVFVDCDSEDEKAESRKLGLTEFVQAALGKGKGRVH